MWSFSYYWEDHLSLSRKYDLNRRRKMKHDLFQKNTRKYDIFFRPSEKKVFSKRAAPGHYLSCIIWKDSIFFPKTRYFFLGQGASDAPPSLQEIHGSRISSVYTCGCYKPGVTHPCQKKSRMALSRKKRLKVIDILDWHSGKSSSSSVCLHRDLYRRFHVLLPCEKKQET